MISHFRAVNSEKFKMDKQRELGIIARFNEPHGNPSGRAYLHGYGLEAYENVEESPTLQNVKPTIENPLIRKALSHFLEVYQGCKLDIFGAIIPNLGFDYIVGIIWGNEGYKLIDFFGFQGIDPDKWPGNPEIYSWVTENGVLAPESDYSPSGLKQITCGDGSIILGEEERYRRTTKNLWDFASNPPKIRGLELEVDVWVP